MSRKETVVEPIEIGKRLHPYENEWVALDRDYEVIASDDQLKELVEKLTPEQQAQAPTFLQVLPHNASFISRYVCGG